MDRIVSRRLAAVVPAVLLLAAAVGARGQDVAPFTEDWNAEDFRARREAVYDAIGPALALVQGAPVPVGYVRFRQSNELYYLTGIETPHAVLLMDGRQRRSTLYLPHRNERREAVEGALLTAEDAERVRALTGVEAVAGTDVLAEHLARAAWGDPVPAVYAPHRPAEGAATSRDLATRAAADVAADPWDGRPDRQARFLALLRERFPVFPIRDLSPILDELRLVKSPKEIELIRRATDLAGRALVEAMRSTEPGVVEYELDALAKFIFFRNGAQGEAYYSLIASGPNAWYPHYHRNRRRMEAGEMVLMDYGPDVGYYATDVTRMWPVDGRFDERQRELYGFYLACYRAILDAIRPGATSAIMDEAAGRMESIVRGWSFSKPVYRRAAERFVADYRRRAGAPAPRLGHGVGMAVHDVGVEDGALRPGMVFTIEPQFRVPEERIYLRLEDVIVVTASGAEVLSADVPMDIDAIEAVMREEGLLQRYPRAPRTGPSVRDPRRD